MELLSEPACSATKWGIAVSSYWPGALNVMGSVRASKDLIRPKVRQYARCERGGQPPRDGGLGKEWSWMANAGLFAVERISTHGWDRIAGMN